MRVQQHDPADDDDARRAGPLHAANGQLWIIGKNGADAHHDGVHERTQTMQMIQCGLAVDVMRMPARSGDAGVEGLSALAHHHQIVGQSLPQRSEISAHGCGNKVSRSRNVFGTIDQSLPGSREPELARAWVMDVNELCPASHGPVISKPVREWNKILPAAFSLR